MTAPYHVSYGYGDHSQKFATLDEAIEFALARRETKADISVMVYGDGAEGGGGDDGTKWHDGLTDEERERLEEAGL